MKHPTIIDDARPFGAEEGVDVYFWTKFNLLEHAVAWPAVNFHYDSTAPDIVSLVDDELAILVREVELDLKEFLFQPASEAGFHGLLLHFPTKLLTVDHT